MFDKRCFWIFFAVLSFTGLHHAQGQSSPADPVIPGIIEIRFGDIVYDEFGSHADLYVGNIFTPLQDLQLTFVTTPYTAIETLFEIPDATILSQSQQPDQVFLSIAATDPGGFVGAFEFIDVEYSAAQEFHTTSFIISGTTVDGASFSRNTEPITFVPEPSHLLALCVLGVSATCRRRKSA